LAPVRRAPRAATQSGDIPFTGSAGPKSIINARLDVCPLDVAADLLATDEPLGDDVEGGYKFGLNVRLDAAARWEALATVDVPA